jgi:ABC-2 type transport system ATP-binding protein
MIDAQYICMNYGPVKAVEDVSFSVGAGEVVGLLGPNGAGKTTIMKILATQIVPTSGTAVVAGNDILTSPLAVRASVGYLPELAPLYDEMEVREYLSFVAAGRKITGRERGARLEWVAENCGLKAVWCRPIGQLSKGYRQRVGLAQALIHDPPALILDEPTSGLDPLQIIEIRQLLRRIAERKAILFSTHILQEITAVSDRILVLDGGRLMAEGRMEELAADFRADDLIRFSAETSEDIEAGLRDLVGVTTVEPLPDTTGVQSYRIHARQGADTARALSLLARERGWAVRELYNEKTDLEAVFTALIRRQRQESASGLTEAENA